jgi:hypothetical protein
MHLTIIGMILTLTTSLNNSTSSPDNTFQLGTVIIAGVTMLLTGIYVAATLALVVITNKQSKNTLAASAKQSQDAIDAVHDQIIASEKQSEAAISAIYKQIEETIHNQHRPILVCPYHPMSDTSLKNSSMPIKNVGVGIALNIRVVLSYASTDAGEKLQMGFILPSVLAAGEKEMISLNTPELHNIPDKIGKYSFFPEDPDSSYKQRLVITYQDIFNCKHLSIFDGRGATNWKPCVIEPNFQYGIDDVCTDWTVLGKKQTKVTYSRRIY